MNSDMLHYTTIPAERKDLPAIYDLFDKAIAFQKANGYIGWQQYDKEFIKADIQKQLLHKIIIADTILCIFCICYSDALIWREREKGDAIYLHRIVLNQEFKGQKAFQKVLDWTILFAKERGLRFIRMDTWAANSKIIDYYKSYGFKFIENFTTSDDEALPVQHRNLNVALLQLDL